MLCADCKLNFDDSASHRHPELFKLRVCRSPLPGELVSPLLCLLSPMFSPSCSFLQQDGTQEDPREVRAAKFDLNYIGLDGNIGCIGVSSLSLLLSLPHSLCLSSSPFQSRLFMVAQ